MVAAAVIGMAAGVLQLPVAFYLLCKSKRVATSSSSSALIFDISLCADVVRRARCSLIMRRSIWLVLYMLNC